MLALSTYELLSAIANNRPIRVERADLEDLIRRGYVTECDHRCSLTEAGRLAYQYGRQVPLGGMARAKTAVG
jgi:hypothetical protein